MASYSVRGIKLDHTVPQSRQQEFSTITFICTGNGSRQIQFSWFAMYRLFRRFDSAKYQDTTETIPCSLECMERLNTVMCNPLSLVINDEDIELLNWLQLKDFRDAHKLYDTTAPKLYHTHYPYRTYKKVEAYVRIDTEDHDPEMGDSNIYCINNDSKV